MVKSLAIESALWTEDQYQLLDSGNAMKLERFGSQVLARPEPQALWAPSSAEWKADASFDKQGEERGEWRKTPRTQEQWWVEYRGLKFRLGLTAFKHVGLFPEQAANWAWAAEQIQERIKAGAACPEVLNLFAYTGGASMAAAQAGAAVTHLDSVKVVNTWARENAEASGLPNIRYITDDAVKFAQREVRREKKYRGIILDPPAYGRGANGEKWVLETDLAPLLRLCQTLLSPEKGSFVVLNLYSMGLSAVLAQTLLEQIFGSAARYEAGELVATDAHHKQLPLGVYVRLTI